MESSSSSIVPFKTNYDVFLSFRGSDTRPSFTSHLYAALSRKHITTFIDDHGLERGEEISSALLKAIEESKVSVVVFSVNYASSPWCLDELVKIIECQKSMRRHVIPVFYHIEPTDVRKQTGNFGKGFDVVKEKFKESSDKVQRWSNALTEAANISGWDSINYRIESELCEEVAAHIMKKLYPISFTTSTDLVGIDLHIDQVLSRLSIGSTDVRLVGIWGMGGIGKTTIAEVIYGQLSVEFDQCCFFCDVREKFEKFKPVHVRKSFYTQLLGIENLDLQTLHVMPTFIVDLLRRKKVLVVLDDVNHPDQLEALAVRADWYGAGSRIILTSRDKQVLKANGVDDHGIYKLEGLGVHDALQLLSMKAFKQNHPPKDYTKLSGRAIDYAKGVPLALKVLGSHLCQRTSKQWKTILNQLEKFPDSNIQKILEISYHELDQGVKDIFLDIACFFRGCDKDWVESILNGCELPSSWGLTCLMDKCLISAANTTVEMHDLIAGLGQDIARREGSRLYDSKVTRNLLSTNMGKKKVTGMSMDLSEIEQFHLSPVVFSRMPNLRLLKFYRPWLQRWSENPIIILEYGQADGLQCLPDKLSLLHWEEYPCKSLPLNVSMENLVELNLTRSSIRYLWHGDKCLENLRTLDLSGCWKLIRLPNLSSATNLELLKLDNCKRLREVPSSIQNLHNLTNLSLFWCVSLRSLPSLNSLKSLYHLRLSNCLNLRMLPEIPTTIEHLELQESGLEEWSPLTPVLDNLLTLSMFSCKNITSFPSNIHLNFVDEVNTTLNLSGLNIHTLPRITGSLKQLYLNASVIEELPSSIGCLTSLVELAMKDCKKLKILPCSISVLKCLRVFFLSGCSNLEKLPPLYGLMSLKELYLDETGVVEIPDDIVFLSSLSSLNLQKCKRLQDLPELPSQLMQLQADGCKLLETAVSSSCGVSTDCSRNEYWFDYTNCLNLNQNSRFNIFSDAHTRITEIAIAENKSEDLWSYVLRMPGIEIPEWFSYQTEGSSIAIQFPSSCFSNMFMGFAFCVVFEPKFPYFRCECRFKNAAGEKHAFFEPHHLEVCDDPESDHTLVWYGEGIFSFGINNWLIENFCKSNEALFEFKQFSPCGLPLKVKRCGVHLIYNQDHKLKESNPSSTCKKSSTLPNLSEQKVEADVNKRSRQSNFYSTSYTKRLKFNDFSLVPSRPLKKQRR